MDSECTIRQIMQEYGTEILRICFIYLKDYHLAEDIVQDTFIKIFVRYNRTGNDDVLSKPYIVKTAVNLCKNQIRTHWFKTIKSNDIMIAKSDKGIDHDKEIIFQKICNLKPIYKDVIILYYYQEMSVNEISSILNIKTGTVKVRLKRARDILKPELMEVWTDE